MFANVRLGRPTCALGVAVALGALCGMSASGIASDSLPGASGEEPVSRQQILSWRMSKDGLGPLRVGLTVRQVERVTGRQMVPVYGRRSCRQWTLAGAPEGLSLITANGRLARVDVYRGTWRTTRRVRRGTRESVFRSRYRGLRTQPHPYTSGKYLIVGGRKRRLIFETGAAGRVTSFRGGRAREVNYIEGCA